MDTALLFDLARFIAGVLVLSYASVTDWFWRRAPNYLWFGLGGFGLVLLGVQYFVGAVALDAYLYLGAAAVFALAAYVFHRLGLIAGGADAKALMALAALAPLPIHLEALPAYPGIVPTPFSILGNALLGILIVPLGLVLVNVARGDFQFPAMLIGYKMRPENVVDSPVWLMDRLEEGRMKRRYMLPHDDAEEQVPLFLEKGIDQVWVTPKVPFMIPLLLGFVLAFTAGDVVFSPIVSLILQR
ncbi:MAG: prepilin peptidase [Euryarchaeota archaeon]|nr:prepilin peptidase [Euryarchaeota archaeon]